MPVQARLRRRPRPATSWSSPFRWKNIGDVPVEPLAGTSHNLFYCGDGQVEYEPAGSTVRQLDAVVHLLGRDLGMSVNSYTAETYLDERDDLRRRFASGDLQGLVAIRCLDEGVDICGKGGQSIPAGVGQPTLLIDGLTVGGTAA